MRMQKHAFQAALTHRVVLITLTVLGIAHHRMPQSQGMYTNLMGTA